MIGQSERQEGLLMLLSTIMQRLNKRCHLHKIIHFSSWKKCDSHPCVIIPITMPKFQVMRHERQRVRTPSMSSAVMRSKSWRPSLLSISEAGSWLLFSTPSYPIFYIDGFPRWAKRFIKSMEAPRFLIHLQPQLQIFIPFSSCRTSLWIPKEAVNLTVILEVIFSDIYMVLAPLFSLEFITNDQGFK